MAEEFTPDVNTRIAQSLGFQGQAGNDKVNEWLRSNPGKVAPYEQLRKTYQPEYSFENRAVEAVPITDYTAQQVQNPMLPVNTAFIPETQQVQQGELQDAQAFNLGDTPQVTAQQAQATQGQSAQVNTQDVVGNFDQDVGQVEASLIGDQTPQAEAQVGEVEDLATVQGQLAKLYADTETGEVPAWAAGAYRRANDVMAARGMQASSIAAGAIVTAMQESALPIAAQDAQTYFQMDMANLSNRQQTELANVQMKQQSLLSDQSIENVSRQINANSSSQNQQFVTSVINSIKEQNATRTQEMERINIEQANSIATVNAGNDLQAQATNISVKNNREQFEKTMQAQIDQANVVWKRSINTANTAAVNAANQANVQNLYNLSQTAYNNLWQQFRDEAAWTFTSSENSATRAANEVIAANNREFALGQRGASENAALYSAAGSFLANMIK